MNDKVGLDSLAVKDEVFEGESDNRQNVIWRNGAAQPSLGQMRPNDMKWARITFFFIYFNSIGHWQKKFIVRCQDSFLVDSSFLQNFEDSLSSAAKRALEVASRQLQRFDLSENSNKESPNVRIKFTSLSKNRSFCFGPSTAAGSWTCSAAGSASSSSGRRRRSTKTGPRRWLRTVELSPAPPSLKLEPKK